MDSNRLREIEEEIYTDLSPTKAAAQALSKKLPIDRRTFGDEAWHFFHFETDDYATVKRTIELSCRVHGWKSPALLSMDQFVQRVTPKASKKGTEQNGEQIVENIKALKEIVNNKPVFVYACYMDSKGDNSASKISANMAYFQIMEAFVLYCSKERSVQNYAQMCNGNAFLDEREVPYYNRLFFISYGSSCVLPDHLRASLCMISYPSLTTEDFRCLLWEYHLRKERMLMAKRQATGRPEGEIQELNVSEELLEWYAGSMAGLEEIKVRRLLASMDSAFVSNYVDYTARDVIEKVIIEYKNDILKQHGRLEVKQVYRGDRVTGLDTIQGWLDTHKNAIKSYTDSPTGILLVGVPGTGKSATAKEAARKLGLTLVQLDMSRILGGRVGDSEKGMREMLDDLQFVAPCVLWIDEVEKAMSGADGKSGDGGTIKRLFGMLLTFIQDNKRPVFTVTTANDISNLPPEFFRNGRFAQTFCLMMPNYEESRAIMQLKLDGYMEKLGWQHKFQLYEAGKILDQCVGTPESPRFLTGADIEAHVQELFWRYKADRLASYPGIESVAKQMAEVSKNVRAQASPAAKYTMEDIAKRYLDMLQRGLTMAGKDGSPYTQDNLDLDKIRYYNFENDTKKNEIPLCLKEPEQFLPYKYVEKMKEKEKAAPAVWYDARFFYELAKAMSEVVFLDKDTTMPETRSEYWKLMKHLHEGNE